MSTAGKERIVIEDCCDKPVPYGLRFENLPSEVFSRRHSNGDRKAVEMEKEYQGGMSAADRWDRFQH